MRKKIRRIALVYPNQTRLPGVFDKITSIPKEPVLLPPLGLLYVAASTTRQVALIDNRVEKFPLHLLLKKLMEYDAVGFSGTIFEAREAMDLAPLLRKEGILTIYGGPNATVNWDLYTGIFDVIFRGEGELLFDELLDSMERGEKPPGFEEVEGTLVNKKTLRVMDLDRLPWPARELLDMSGYKREEEDYLPGTRPVDTVVSSRGCPFDCSFCSSSIIWESLSPETSNILSLKFTRIESIPVKSRSRAFNFSSSATPNGRPNSFIIELVISFAP